MLSQVTVGCEAELFEGRTIAGFEARQRSPEPGDLHRLNSQASFLDRCQHRHLAL